MYISKCCEKLNRTVLEQYIEGLSTVVDLTCGGWNLFNQISEKLKNVELCFLCVKADGKVIWSTEMIWGYTLILTLDDPELWPVPTVCAVSWFMRGADVSPADPVNEDSRKLFGRMTEEP